MRRSYSLMFVLCISFVLLLVPSALAQEETPSNPAGYPISQALYVTMRDGVQIAIDVWLPDDLETDQQIPTVMRMTRYWRGIQNLPPEDTGGETDMLFRDAGYAVVTVDARGTGASEGQREIEWPPDEVADYGEIVDWIVAQPWSNGRVGAYGISYEGNTAELLTVPNHPAVKAVAPLFSDVDPLYVAAMPGGLLNPGFIQTWSDVTWALDSNDICTLAEAEGAQCMMTRVMVPGVKQTDDDPDRTHLDEIVAQRDIQNVFDAISGVTYRDDPYGDSGYSLADVSPYALREQIEASGVPMLVWVGWMDAATVEQALGRYATFSNPQELVIGPWDHGAANDADPFKPADTPVQPDPMAQFEQLLDFFDPYLLGEDAPTPASSVTYYTMNAGTWTTVESWPPPEFEPQTFYFGEDATLTEEIPASASGADTYVVDFTVSAGPRESNRWATQVDAPDVYYPDRAEEDAKRLIFTSEPLENTVEITGTPVVNVYMASTHDDGALHVYLEAVAPDGKVVYLTEGVLRLIHRVSEQEPHYAVFGPYHSFERADAAPLMPGEITEVNLGLLPTSIVVPEGYQLRVALAGADANMFARYPAEGDPVWTVERNADYPSHIVIPMTVTDKTPLVP